MAFRFYSRFNPGIPVSVISVVLLQCSAIVNSIAFHPDTSNRALPIRLPPCVEERFITAPGNIRLQCYIVRDTGQAYAALYCHGNAGNNDWQIGDLIAISKMGLTVFAVDYRGYGKSGGRPSEKGICLDAGAAFRYVKDSLGFREKNIFIIGSSLGTAAAITTARNRDIAGLVLVAPLTTGKEYARFHGYGLLSWAAGNSFDNLAKIREIKCPLLVIHGTQDRLIPFSMGTTLFDRATTEKTFVGIDGGHHGDLSVVDGKRYWGAMTRFINRLKFDTYGRP